MRRRHILSDRVVAAAVVGAMALVLGASGCGSSGDAPSATAGPNPTTNDPGPNPTAADPGPNPTSTGTERTVAGRLEVRGACSTLRPDVGPQVAVHAEPPYGFDTDGLVRDRSLVAPYGSRVVAVVAESPTGACGPEVRLVHLVSVLER
jgi:hypothetical protein